MALLKLCLLLLALTAVSCLDERVLRFEEENCEKYRNDFEAFKGQHNRKYATLKDEEHRFKIFCQNMEKAKVLQEEDRGTAEYGVTKFADISEAEFRQQYLGLKVPANYSSSLATAEIPKDPLPQNFDWREKGIVNPVQEQGPCASSWAFSAVGTVEAQWALIHNKLYNLSVQELLDCDKDDHGCRRGIPPVAYGAIFRLGGLEQSSDYEYKGRVQDCKFNKTKVVAKVIGGIRTRKNETDMAKWLYKNGPLSIAINAINMQWYRGGIAHPAKPACLPENLNHHALIVGFGVEKGVPYWIIKNSWGVRWGILGYYLVYRGDNTCGLNHEATSASVPK